MNHSIERIAVIGAGTMGNGIAQACAMSGHRVTMIDLDDASLRRGLTTINDSLGRLVKKEKLAATDLDAVLARIATGTDYDLLDGSDVVIEAATENLDLKLRILRQIEAHVGDDAVIASNTSSISITQMAAVLGRPERCIGLHFFNPVPMMALVELIRGLQTSDATHAAARTFVASLGKTPITAKNSPGFSVNRILCPMLNEAIFTLQEGIASAHDIDIGMQLGCNHPIGPLALADLVGLDVLHSVMTVFWEGFRDPKYRPAPLLREMVDAGRLGRKTGQGFFTYEATSRA